MKAAIWSFDRWIMETDPSILREAFDQALVGCGFTIIDFIDYHFEPQGWSGLWLIAESHLGIHTFPEEEKSYVQLSSCSEEYHRNFTSLMNKRNTRLFREYRKP